MQDVFIEQEDLQELDECSLLERWKKLLPEQESPQQSKSFDYIIFILEKYGETPPNFIVDETVLQPPF